MKRKWGQQLIAMVLAAAMLTSTLGSTGLAETLHQENAGANAVGDSQKEEKKQAVKLPERVKEWEDGYETVSSLEEAEALRIKDETANILVALEEGTLSGLTFGEMATSDTEKLTLTDLSGKVLDAAGTSSLWLYGTKLEQLYLKAEEGETVSLHLDGSTEIPEIILEGSGSFCIEGNGILGMVQAKDAAEQLIVRATCSVLNGSGESIRLEKADGNVEELQSGEQKEVSLSAYLISFLVDGENYQTEAVKPGETIPFPETKPEKEGYIFTAWYTDEEFTQPCSQFAVAEGQMTLYARFVDETDAIQVTFDSMGGRKLEPQIFAKGETLLTRAINEIYTEKEGFTFGGWCTDEECTNAFSYTEPLEEDLTLYAFFVSDEVQETTKDGNIASLDDFDWQDAIVLRTEEKMTLKEVEQNVQIQAGTGGMVPEIAIEETGDGFQIRGTYYEKDGAFGFEPGATFSILLSGGVHFADYPEETDTAVVSVYKEQVEVVGFSEDMNYVLWDDVLEYVPVTIEEEDEDAQEAETEVVDEEQETAVSDNDGESAEEQETAAYTPGTVLVKDTGTYQIGDLVAFYDGEIGRDEKSMELYTDGSFDGYVLFAQILKAETQDDGVLLTYGYANPEDYLADFDVHLSDDVDLEEELSDTDIEVLASRLSRQVEENEELKAQMLVSVMSAPETQEMLDDMYGEGVYALAGMTAALTPGKPTVQLSVSGSSVTAKITVSATATIRKDGRVMLTVKPSLSFTQSVSVTMNVDGGAVWIDMSVAVRSTSAIELKVTASSGKNSSIFSKAADALSEIVKPEGIKEGEYESYDESVSDLMDTMNSIVGTSLKYNDLFDVLLLKLSYSFYGIITVSFEVHLVGQVGVLATFGVEIIATSGEKIGFKYNFLKFKGSSYTEKLESSVTNNIYLIGKVGARVGLRLVLSVTLCGIASASISGSVYAYAELTGLFFNTTNLLSGANSNLGALNFEVGIDVVVSLGLRVKLIFKTIRKNWTVYQGRWPLWSTSVSSKMSYMNEEKLKEEWEEQSADADHKSTFGFASIPMKTWDLASGKCTENQILSGKSAGKGAKITLEIKNLMVNGEAVPEGDPKNELFHVGDSSKGENAAYLYMDETVAAEQLCEEAELDLVLTYENNSSSALVKKQEATFHLKKKCSLATTTQNVQVVLQDWCARNWDLESAEWDNAVIYETSFQNSHVLGQWYEPTATGVLEQGEILAAAQTAYPELSELICQWSEPAEDGTQAVMQYSDPKYSSFCYMTPENGVVRYDVLPSTDSYDVTYYLYVRRFEGFEDTVRYHIRLNGAGEEDLYEFTTAASESGETLAFEKEEDGTYLLEAKRGQFDTSEQPLMMAVNGETAVKTGLVITGWEMQQDVWFDLSVGSVLLGIQLGNGVASYEFADPSIVTEEGIKPGTRVQLNVTMQAGYGGLEAVSTSENAALSVTENAVSFVMPPEGFTVTLQAYRLHSITYKYNYKGQKDYQKVYFAENQVTEKAADPKIDGLTFRGWYTTSACEGEPFTFGTKLQTDVILYADWTCDVTVHFTPARGTASYLTGTEETAKEVFFFKDHGKTYYKFTYSTQRVGEKLLDIQIPEYEGYQFMDWYTDPEFEGKPVDLETYVLTGGVHLYARWAKMVPVTFYANTGMEDGIYDEVTGFTGYPLTILPEDPVREHYKFVGWYKNPAATEAFDVQKEKISRAISLYAGWKAVDYEISYDLGGGVNAASNPKTYTIEKSFTLAEPTREGYTFVGWTGTDLKETSLQVNVSEGNSGKRTYQAVWKPIEYTIKYERTYGTALENPVSYTIESDEIVLVNPTREKYQFKGWITDGQADPELTVRIPTGSMGNRVYTAVWETDDPILTILEKAAILASGNPYEGNLADFLTKEEISEGEMDPEKLGSALGESIETCLMDLIAADSEIGSYSGNLQIKAAYDKEFMNWHQDPENQNYQYNITINYLEDDGSQKPENTTTFTYSASLRKLVPAVTWPTAGNLKYGETVSQSSFAEDGSAKYAVNETAEDDVTVSGNFTWDSTELNKVPFRVPGEENSYTAVFTPNDDGMYAEVKGTVVVLTQIGVAVSCEAEERYYLPNDTTATGTAVLVYVNQTGQPTENVCDVEGLLQGGTWTFDSDQPGENRVVTYTGCSLKEDKNTENAYGNGAYVLVDTSNKAVADADYRTTTKGVIKKVVQDPANTNLMIQAPTTEAASYVYETRLGENADEITLKAGSGKVQYKVSDTKTETIEGTWSWQNEEKGTVPNAGTNSYPAVFTPDTKYGDGYGSFTADVTVTITKKTVNLPQVSGKTYTGTSQQADVTVPEEDRAKYTVSVEGKTNAGSYTVNVTLKDANNYAWETKTGVILSGSNSETAAIPWKIEKANVKMDVSKATEFTVLYGQKLTSAAQDTVTKRSAILTGYSGSWENASEKEHTVETQLTAKGKIPDLNAEYESVNGNKKVTSGTWSWVTDKDGKLTVKNGSKIEQKAQPLNVSTAAYQVKAVFTPSDTNLNAYEVYLPVKVEKSTPYAPYGLTAVGDGFFLPKGKSFKLSRISIKEKTQPLYNSYTGQTVSGQWNWDDSNANVNTRQYDAGAQFALTNTADKNNYGIAKAKCRITSRDYVNVTLYLRSNITTGSTGTHGLVTDQKGTVSLKIYEGTVTEANDFYLQHTIYSQYWKTVYQDGFWVTDSSMRETGGEYKSINTYLSTNNSSSGKMTVPEDVFVFSSADWYRITVSMENFFPQGDITITIDVTDRGYASKQSNKSKRAVMMLPEETETELTEATTEAVTEIETAPTDAEKVTEVTTEGQTKPTETETVTTEAVTEEQTKPTEAPAESETKPSETEAPKQEPAHTEAPQTEASKQEPAQTEAPQTEAPKQGPAQTEAPKQETPQTKDPETEAPKKEESQPQAAPPEETAVS